MLARGSGAELERLRDPSDLPGLAAYPSPPSQRTQQLLSDGAHLDHFCLSRKRGSEEQQPAGLCPQDSLKL